LLAVAAAVSLLVVTGSATAAPAASPVKTIKPGQLTIGSEIPYPPFEIGTAQNISGFEADLVNEIAKRLGLKPVWKNAPFNSIFNQLRQGAFDMVASDVTVTKERKKIIDYATPFGRNDLELISKKGGTQYASLASLAGKTIAVQQGSVAAEWAKKVKDATLREYPTAADALRAVMVGQADASLGDAPVVLYLYKTTKNPGFTASGLVVTGDMAAFAIRKGNRGLVSALNSQLAALKKDGTYASLSKKYFGSAAPK
jgi:polar amino acid transport system substrate-binding protein